MAHKMIDIWSCDRCGLTQHSPFKNDPQLSIKMHYFGYTDPDVKWDDFCPACHSQIVNVVRGLVIHNEKY